MKIKKIASFVKTNRIINLLCFALVLSLFSCNESRDDKVRIFGNINEAGGKIVTLELLSPNSIEPIAVVEIDEHGDFEINLDSIVNSFYRLKLDDKNFIYLRLVEGDEIEISGEYPKLSRTYKISGSEDCDLLKEMNSHLIESTDKLNNMNNQIVEARKIPNYNVDSLFEKVNSEARKLYDSDRQYLINFINKNNHSAVIYMALYQYVSVSPILMIEFDLETFEYALSELKSYHPDLEQTALLESEVSKEKLRQQQMTRDYVQLRPGVIAPDFVLQDAYSAKKSLSSFRGKNVVLVFWSSWNKPSVKTVTKLHDMIKSNEANLILISVDTQKENWVNAINSAGIDDAINLCDFKSFESPVLKIYGIVTIPTIVLINSDGIVEKITQDTDEIKVGLIELLS